MHTFRMESFSKGLCEKGKQSWPQKLRRKVVENKMVKRDMRQE